MSPGSAALSPSPGHRWFRFACRYFPISPRFLPFTPTTQPGPSLGLQQYHQSIIITSVMAHCKAWSQPRITIISSINNYCFINGSFLNPSLSENYCWGTTLESKFCLGIKFCSPPTEMVMLHFFLVFSLSVNVFSSKMLIDNASTSLREHLRKTLGGWN